jgi:hypothetical protein
MSGSRPDRRLRLAALAAGVLLAAPWAVRALGRDALPPRVQASLFKRIFAYDPVLHAKPRLSVVVLHGRLTAAQAGEVAEAFEAEGFAVAQCEIDHVPAALDEATVLYALPDVPAHALGELARSRRLLTVSGDGDAVQRGDVSVALRRSATGQPEIVVHRPRLASEGHELSARLLKLATVVP